MDKLKHLIIDIEDFLRNLNQPLLSEIQLEVLMAIYLKELKQEEKSKYDEVYLEYSFYKRLLGDEYIWGKENDRISVDLVVKLNNEYIPIEIKFKTKNESLFLRVFGDGPKITLTEQSAKNEACYGFWKDVKRIELIKAKFNNVNGGIVLFVTNAETYKKEPEKGSQYAPFSLHHKRIVKGKEKALNWYGSDASVKRKRKFPGFKISNNYELIWKDLNTTNQGLHYLLLLI